MNFNQHWVYHNIERPLIPAIVAMEDAGIMVDVVGLGALHDELAEAQAELLQTTLSGLNPNSVPQLRKLLYGEMRLPVIKSTKSGPSTDEMTIRKLLTYADESGKIILQAILINREYAKMRGTYAAGLLSAVSSDGRIHSRLHQVGTETGRTSSSNPNLQNQPADSKWGRAFRKCFIAGPGNELVVADYSQIELRLMATMSGETFLLDAFENDEDVHLAVTTQILGLHANERHYGKTLNFGLGYGMEAKSLSNELGISISVAAEMLRRYWERLPLLRGWIDESRHSIVENGYAKTMFGRRNYVTIPQEHWLREKALREGVNMQVQGTAADVIKLLMPHTYAEAMRLGALQLLLVHDELIFEAPATVAEELAWRVKELAEGIVDVGVRLKMEVGVGPNWWDAKENHIKGV